MNQIRILPKFGIDINEHSAMYDSTGFVYRVDALVSADDIRRIESAGYSVEKVSDFTEIAKSRLKQVSSSHEINDMNTNTD